MFSRTAFVLVLSLHAMALAQDPAAAPPSAPDTAPAAPDAGDGQPSADAPKPKAEPKAKALPALTELNLFWKGVSEKNRSGPPLFNAWIVATPMPAAVPSPENIWPGMEGFDAWKKWVQANPGLREAILKAQGGSVLGIPYGEEGLDPAWKAKGVAALPGSAAGEAAFPYLAAIRGLAAYATVAKYVDAEAKQFDGAFDVSIAMLRVLRQVCEQRMEVEKIVGMDLMCKLLESDRVFMAANLEAMPVAALQRAALKGYPYIKPGDNERLKRMELPEGDRLVLTESMPKAFNGAGQPDEQFFASTFGAIQSANAPLTRFGASARWRELSKVHGSLEASQEKLIAIYDDWWRRWRMRFYDPILDVPTQFSKLNQSKYAMVTLFVENLQQVFDARLRLIAEIDGTAMSAAVCGFYIDSAKQWPRDLASAFPIYGMRRMNFDPYAKDYGTLQYRNLGEKTQPLGTPWGQVQVGGAVLWSVGPNHIDDDFAQHDAADGTGDIVFWPPPRFLARQAGLLK
jgi:hypothetical protein